MRTKRVNFQGTSVLGVVISLGEARDPAAGLKPILDLVSADMAGVNAIILDKAVSDVDLIPKLAHHLIDSGGKRLRPMLTIAAAKLVGYRVKAMSASLPRSSSCTRPRCFTMTLSTKAMFDAASARPASYGATRPVFWSAISCLGKPFG